MIGINLEPSPRYFEFHKKSGKLNMSGTIKKILQDLPDGTTFRSIHVESFLMKCGSGIDALVDTHHYQGFNPGKVNSSLNNIVTREEYLRKPMTNYFEVRFGEDVEEALEAEQAEEVEMSIDDINEFLFG